MKKYVIVLILVICICVAFLLLIDVLHRISDFGWTLACENTLRAIGHAFETYKANHEGSPPSSLLVLKDYIKEEYVSDSAGIPISIGNRNEDETSDTPYYVYNPSLSTDENKPICWDSTPHRISGRFLPDTYIWIVLYADGHIERLNRRKFFSLMRSIGVSDPNYPSPKYNETVAAFSGERASRNIQNKLFEKIDTRAALQKTFETEYRAWKKHCESVSFSSKTSDRLESQHFMNLVAKGPKILPYIVDKSVEDKNFDWIGWLVLSITKTNTDPTVNPWAKETTISNWWKGGRKQARERFESLYKKWKDHKVKGMSVEADKTKKSIRALGIETLPFLVEKVKQGDTELVEVVSELTGGKVERNAFIFQCLEWWEKDKENWLIPFPNNQPVAEAGLDMVVKSGDVVEFDGSASIDADKDELTYGWIQIAGPFIKLWSNSKSWQAFKAPAVRKRTTLIFQLIVYDGSLIESVHPLCQSGRSKPDTIKIVVNP